MTQEPPFRRRYNDREVELIRHGRAELAKQEWSDRYSAARLASANSETWREERLAFIVGDV